MSHRQHELWNSTDYNMKLLKLLVGVDSAKMAFRYEGEPPGASYAEPKRMRETRWYPSVAWKTCGEAESDMRLSYPHVVPHGINNFCFYSLDFLYT